MGAYRNRPKRNGGYQRNGGCGNRRSGIICSIVGYQGIGVGIAWIEICIRERNDFVRKTLVRPYDTPGDSGNFHIVKTDTIGKIHCHTGIGDIRIITETHVGCYRYRRRSRGITDQIHGIVGLNIIRITTINTERTDISVRSIAHIGGYHCTIITVCNTSDSHIRIRMRCRG